MVSSEAGQHERTAPELLLEHSFGETFVVDADSETIS